MNQTSLKRKSYFLYSESARTLFRVALQYSVHESDCVGCISLKRSELGVYIPLKENKLACFTNREGSFRVKLWFMISGKSITRFTFLHRDGTRMHQKSQGTQKNCAPQFLILPALDVE